jgi:hypothetical protein
LRRICSFGGRLSRLRPADRQETNVCTLAMMRPRRRPKSRHSLPLYAAGQRTRKTICQQLDTLIGYGDAVVAWDAPTDAGDRVGTTSITVASCDEF